MVRSYKAAPGIHVVSSSFPIPGFGMVPINAFVIDGSEPVLVDTGAVVESEPFMQALRAIIDPADLRWLWLTHTDFDHIGSLAPLLDENPGLRVITTFRGVGIMSLFAPLPLDRVHLVNPGEEITVGDHTLRALQPPVFDNPSTTGFYDETSRVVFSSDCFGALLADVPEQAADLAERELLEGQVFWATLDAPWLHHVDAGVLARRLDAIRALDPKFILSSHLPPASGTMTERLLASLEAARVAQEFIGPDQAALQHLLAALTGPLVSAPVSHGEAPTPM